MLSKGVYLVGVIFLSCLWASSVLAQPIVLKNDQSNHVFKASAFFIYFDSLHQQSVEALPQGVFKPASVDVPSLGYVRVPVWVRFEVENKSPFEDWLLHYDWVFSDTVELFVKDSTGAWVRKYRAGYTLPFQNRPLDYPSFAYPLGLKSGEKATFYVRVQSGSPIALPFYLKRTEVLQTEQRRADILYGIYFGTLIVMLFYNFVVWIFLKDRSYLYYTFTIICTLSIFASVSGYIAQFVLFNYPKLNIYFSKIFIGLIVPATALFANEFLNIRKYVPVFIKIFRVMMFLAGIAIIHVFFNHASSWSNKVVTLHTPLLLGVGIWVWYKGNKSARFFVLAWTFYIIGGLIITLSNAGLLPATGIYRHLAEVGSALEVVLLSLALSDRYRIFKKEKEEAQAQNLRLVKDQNMVLEQKVSERTAEILQQKEEIEVQSEELQSTNNALHFAYQEIQKKNDDIIASINYALRIQNAILPKESELQKHLDCFVFFRPRDIVSGDFYWFAEKVISDEGQVASIEQTSLLSTKHSTLTTKIIAVADCTGHGVSGAFMTLIGNTILNQIVNDYGICEPDKILNLMSPLLAKTLLHSEGKIRDGMDISIVAITPPPAPSPSGRGIGNNPLPNGAGAGGGLVTYAGAMNPLYYVQNQEFKELKADKRPIGGKIDDDFSYKKHEVLSEQGQVMSNSQEMTDHSALNTPHLTLYLCSDGFQDQFGGEHDKKFMVKKLKNLLFEISEKTMAEQKELLEKTFDTWKDKEKQTDDVLVVGIRV